MFQLTAEDVPERYRDCCDREMDKLENRVPERVV